jgi:hypothetical protein
MKTSLTRRSPARQECHGGRILIKVIYDFGTHFGLSSRWKEYVMRSAFLSVLLSIALVGCSQANAKTLDPEKDVHCSVLAFYFHGLGEHRKMPEHQLRPARDLHLWYAAKLQAELGDRNDDPGGFDREVGPLLEIVKADQLAARDELEACASRAASDPDFTTFRQRLARVESS